MKLGDIPVVMIGPGSQPQEEDGAQLEYISMPSDMATYTAPLTPEPEEVENLLTDIMFINDGKILLDSTMDALGETYIEVMTSGENTQKARGFGPVAEAEMFGKSVMLFEGVSREHLEELGEIRTVLAGYACYKGNSFLSHLVIFG